MVCIWQKFVQNIIGRQCQTGGVDAWVAADELILEQVSVDQKLDTAFRVVHRSEHAYRALSDIEILLHMLGASEAQTGRAYLL